MKEIIRYTPEITVGLTKEQVKDRFNQGLNNYDDQPRTKTMKEIIVSNFFT